MNYIKLLSLIFIISSCIDKEKTLDNGVLLKYFKNGSGNQIKDDEIMLFNLQYFDYEGTELFNRSGDQPVIIQKDSTWSNRGYIYEVLGYLKKGDSVFFQLTLDQFFSNAPTGVSFPDSLKDESMSFYLGVKDIMSQDEFAIYQKDLYEKMEIQNMEREKEMELENAKQLSVDLELIDTYLSNNNIDAVKTESGLRYVITNKGTGPNAAPGNRVRVHYTGMLLDGTTFDSSVERGVPFDFNLGQGQVIKGWDEGVSYFNKGAKGTIYIPSSLGYGPSGAGGVIPPNAVLIFDIELISF